MNLLQICWVAGLLVCGMGVALLGSIKVPLAKRLEMDEARVGGLVSMFGFAMIPVMLVMGFLTDLLDKKLVVIAGCLLITSSLVVIALARRYATALFSVLLLSAGWSGVVNVLNVLMQPAFGGSPTYAMNLGNFFFGLGAFLTPLFIAFLSKKAGFVNTLFVLAVVALLPGVLAFTVDFAALAGPAAKQEAGPGIEVLLTDPIMWLTALALLFYAPMEATMGAWTTTYLSDKRASETLASAMLSTYWLAFTIARLGTALLVGAFPLTASGTGWLIVGLAVFCVLVWLGAVISPNRGMACAMVALAGIAFGPTFPTIVGVLTGHVHPAVAGRAVGLFFMIGGIGWSLIPILIGAYARKTSVQRAFLIAVGSAVGLTVTAVVLRSYMV
jgi:fucose permease